MPTYDSISNELIADFPLASLQRIIDRTGFGLHEPCDIRLADAPVSGDAMATISESFQNNTNLASDTTICAVASVENLEASVSTSAILGFERSIDAVTSAWDNAPVCEVITPVDVNSRKSSPEVSTATEEDIEKVTQFRGVRLEECLEKNSVKSTEELSLLELQQEQRVQDFFIVLALCNTTVISVNKNNPTPICPSLS
ncbi:unnamed protein product [Protopolystoma xenopodis]|uniref:Uncharacterized protein n=1 Tax=Protopolystoma xenopodis TaxID=117903 RepID=A0A3S5CQ17_9PLAT|nr:unnamed protein product [Protopolystoma xenopodis]